MWAAPYFQNIDFLPIDTIKLHSLSKLLPERKGYVWLQNTFTIPKAMQNQKLGLYIGKVEIACSILINGKEIGKCGFFPPDEFSQGTGASAFYIPSEYLNQNGKNKLMIKVWCNGGGNIQSLPFIGLYNDVSISAKQFTFANSGINLVFAGGILLVALSYLYLFIRQSTEKEYLYYSLMCLVSAVYLYPFYMSEFPWLFKITSLLTFRKALLGIIAFIDVYLATSFIRIFLKYKDSIYVKAVRITLLVAALINTLALQDLRTFTLILPVIFSYAFFQLCFAIWAVVQALIEKKKEVIQI